MFNTNFEANKSTPKFTNKAHFCTSKSAYKVFKLSIKTYQDYFLENVPFIRKNIHKFGEYVLDLVSYLYNVRRQAKSKIWGKELYAFEYPDHPKKDPLIVNEVIFKEATFNFLGYALNFELIIAIKVLPNPIEQTEAETIKEILIDISMLFGLIVQEIQINMPLIRNSIETARIFSTIAPQNEVDFAIRKEFAQRLRAKKKKKLYLILKMII